MTPINTPTGGFPPGLPVKPDSFPDSLRTLDGRQTASLVPFRSVRPRVPHAEGLDDILVLQLREYGELSSQDFTVGALLADGPGEKNGKNPPGCAAVFFSPGNKNKNKTKNTSSRRCVGCVGPWRRMRAETSSGAWMPPVQRRQLVQIQKSSLCD